MVCSFSMFFREAGWLIYKHFNLLLRINHLPSACVAPGTCCQYSSSLAAIDFKKEVEQRFHNPRCLGTKIFLCLLCLNPTSHRCFLWCIVQQRGRQRPLLTSPPYSYSPSQGSLDAGHENGGTAIINTPLLTLRRQMTYARFCDTRVCARGPEIWPPWVPTY